MLCDTNILLRYCKRDDPEHAAVTAAVQHAVATGETMETCPQCVYEFWVVATRPSIKNGFGWDVVKTKTYLDQLLKMLILRPDPVDLTVEWMDLCTKYAVLGRQAHDARIAALMLCHGIDKLLTLNPSDFARFTEISVVTPAQLMNA